MRRAAFWEAILQPGSSVRGIAPITFDKLSRLEFTSNRAWLRSQGQVPRVHGDIRNNYDVERVVRDVRPDAIFRLVGGWP